MEIGVVLSGIWLGFSWFVVAFMVFLAVGMAYLSYLVRRFTRPSWLSEILRAWQKLAFAAVEFLLIPGNPSLRGI